jgi:MYXO-CTERM domain-containing protein
MLNVCAPHRWLWLLALVTGVLALAEPARARIAIPAQTDWVEQGVALTAGPAGSWDVRLYGQISPCAVVKKDGTYFLYYVGADGDRATDGGPRNRALGVATSLDGIHFTKHGGNPVFTHLPHGNEEEGIFSAGATVSGDTIHLLYGAIWAANATTESVQGHLGHATSTDGLTFTDHGYVVSWDDPTVWGSGDELIPVGLTQVGSEWLGYYIAKGSGFSWDLGLARGPSIAALAQTTGQVLVTGDIIGGGDPVWLDDDVFALFLVRSFTDNRIEVRTASAAAPGTLSQPVQTYTTFPPGYRHTTVILDREESLWFMYQSTDREADGNHIVVRTAPAVEEVATAVQDYQIGPEETAGTFQGSRPSVAVDSLDQPHMVVDQGWANTLYIYHRIGGSWSEELFAQGNWGANRNYLPHIEIDQQDRAWISSWYATSNVVPECGQGVWLLSDMATAPAEVFHVKIYITWANGNLSHDPAHPDEAAVMARDGSWKKVGTSGQELGSGQMGLGITGEKLRFLISPRDGADGVWHGVMSGYPPSHSAYRNSAMADIVTWADYDAYPEQGLDTRHPSLGIDLVDPEVAYIAIGYNPGVVVNIWDGNGLVFDPANLPVVGPAPANHGNDEDRFGPQWTPAHGGGAFLCWTGSDGQVRLREIHSDGTMEPTRVVTEGRRCAMATDSRGRIHMVYERSGMRYRLIVPPGEATFTDFQPSAAVTNQRPDCSVTVAVARSGLDPAAVSADYSRDGGATWTPWAVESTAAAGSTQPETLIARAVPFDQESDTLNRIRFRVQTRAGAELDSPVYTVVIGEATTQADGGPTGVDSGSGDATPNGGAVGGCGCSSPGADGPKPSPGALLLLLALVALAVARRRRSPV